MATYQIFKETALPGTLQAHSIYLVAPAARPDFVEVYVTGTTGSVVKRVIDAAQVQSMIDASMSGVGGLAVADDISARNALSPTSNIMVYVVDATGDATVASGGATYIYRQSSSTWIKISEAESLDLSISWASIVGKPSSSAAAIDTAVANSHTHTNKTQLDKIGEDGNGQLLYNGAKPTIDWNSTGW